MADDSLQFATDDSDFTAKMNRKTVFVGTGTQINSIINPYSGQYALCTVTGSGFTADRIYIRNNANTSWVLKRELGGGIEESSEVGTTPTSTNSGSFLTNRRKYDFFTLPTTEDFYLITGIEWKILINNGGFTVAGVDIVNANPPTLNGAVLAAVSPAIAPSGTTQRTSQIASDFIMGGTICGVWISSSGTTQYDALIAGAGKQKSVGYTASPPTHDSTAFATDTDNLKYSIKAYYRGYTKTVRTP